MLSNLTTHFFAVCCCLAFLNADVAQTNGQGVRGALQNAKGAQENQYGRPTYSREGDERAAAEAAKARADAAKASAAAQAKAASDARSRAAEQRARDEEARAARNRAAVAAQARARGGARSQPRETTKPGKFEELLANKDLSRFRGYHDATIGAGWKMDGKTVHFDGSGGGDMITVEEYENFELQFDWKVSAGGNSGVLYRVSLGDDVSYLSGIEYQVLDDAGHTDGKKAWNSAGSVYGLYAPQDKKLRATGIWNSTKIIVDGNSITHYLNGKRIVQAQIGSEDWNTRLQKSKFARWQKFARNSSGHIAFRDDGDEVWYRKIRIKRLASTAGPSQVVGNRQPAARATRPDPRSRPSVIPVVSDDAPPATARPTGRTRPDPRARPALPVVSDDDPSETSSAAAEAAAARGRDRRK